MTHPLIKELREIRRHSKISQDAVGAALGTVASQICQYETGYHSPKVDILVSWADTLGYELVLRAKA